MRGFSRSFKGAAIRRSTRATFGLCCARAESDQVATAPRTVTESRRLRSSPDGRRLYLIISLNERGVVHHSEFGRACPGWVDRVGSAMFATGPLSLRVWSNHAPQRIDEMCHERTHAPQQTGSSFD